MAVQGDMGRRRPTQMPSPALAVVQTHTITTANECLKNIPRTTLAAREVCHVLMLNAWRKRRHDVQEHTLTIQQLKSQVENLNIQIIVLRRLLDSEKERVAKAHQAVQEMLEQVTESIQEKNVLKGKKEELEKEISHLEECIGDMQTKNQNVKNDYLTAMTEVKVLETQLGKEREKLVKLRENKKHLLNKIHTNEEFVTTKNVIIEQLQQSCEDMEAKLKSEVEQRKQAEVHNEESKQAIKQLEMKHEKLEADLKTVTDASCQLSLKIQTLESLLENREQQNNALQITIQDQQVEIRALQARHTELQSSWGARALDIAAMFARLPFSILYNMGVIFLPHNN